MKCVQGLGGRMSKENCHFLILDGHNSHLTLNVAMQAMDVGLDPLTLTSHTSHARQSLDIPCFKTFKGLFRHCNDVWSLANKGRGASREDLAHWVSISLRRVLATANILVGFKVSGIWSFDDTKLEGKVVPPQVVKLRRKLTICESHQSVRILANMMWRWIAKTHPYLASWPRQHNWRRTRTSFKHNTRGCPKSCGYCYNTTKSTFMGLTVLDANYFAKGNHKEAKG